ncbi:hypothetical protein ACA910_015766 [Epithemia clementina (nom. ined.)]
MSLSYCEQLGLDYKCDEPLPRSAFNKSGPLCASLAEYLYDPANCDPGFWSGCASTDPKKCIPSNDTNATLWGGHFTTINVTTGETIVFTGRFGDSDDGSDGSCPLSYYCPGKDVVEMCVDLCPPKFYCPNPSTMIECPEEYYCPVASSVPRKCENLETCQETGLRRFNVGVAMVFILIILIVSILYLYCGRYAVIRSARARREAKMRNKIPSKHRINDPDDDDHNDESGDNEEDGKNNERKGPGVTEEGEEAEEQANAAGAPKQKRRSTITSPDMTIDIECERLRLTIPKVGTVMRGVSGKLEHGKLTAIMGPSGAGKTTFLSLMSGKVDRTGGKLRVNGEEANLTEFRRVIGFVPQEDIMMRELTVEENVAHSALMRLPVEWSYQKKMERVDEILESLEIDHVRDSVVGDEKRRGISGGQRKRVNIAMEMVVKPSLLCLDEPTSGLDSTTSYTVVNSLKEMARAGANVITVLHQPKYEVFQLFDNVLLLGKGGMTVYYGPTSGMASYFSKRGFPCPAFSNPADFYMDVLSGIIPHPDNPKWDKEDLFEEWMCADENPDSISRIDAQKTMEEIRAEDSQTKEADAAEDRRERRLLIGKLCSVIYTELKMVIHHLGSNVGPDHTGRKTPGTFTQFYLLFKRANLQRLRSPFATVLNIILMFLAGAVIPSLVSDDENLYVGIPKTLEGGTEAQQAYMRENVKPVDAIPGIMLNVYLFLLIVSCLSVNVYGPERVVFFRETAVGQSVFSYWAAKSLDAILWLPIYTCAFVLLGYSGQAWLIQPLRSYWFFLFLDLVGFYGFGMLASLLVGAGSAALLALVFGIIVIVGFSGAVTAYGDQSSGGQTFTTFWFLFWSTQGLSAKEYEQFTYAFNVTQLNDETPDKYNNEFGIGEQTVGAGVGMGFDLDSSYARNLGMCALTAFAWYIIVLWTLKTKDHRKHR